LPQPHDHEAGHRTVSAGSAVAAAGRRAAGSFRSRFDRLLRKCVTFRTRSFQSARVLVENDDGSLSIVVRRPARPPTAPASKHIARVVGVIINRTACPFCSISRGRRRTYLTRVYFRRDRFDVFVRFSGGESPYDRLAAG